MLQFFGIMSNSAARFGQARLNSLLSSQQFSTSFVLSSKPALEKKQPVVSRVKAKDQQNLVKAAFQNLNNVEELKKPYEPKAENKNKNKNLDGKSHVDLVNFLLDEVQKSPGLEHKTLKTFKILMTWAKNGEIELTQFINDPRFLKLLDGMTFSKNKDFSPNSESLYDAANSLNFSGHKNESMDQLITLLVILSKKRYRNVSELNNISEKIINSKTELNVKQTADVLYCMAVLNFPHEVLMNKICNNLLQTVPITTKASIIGSILTSLGMLWYKHAALLDTLSTWAVKNWSQMRPQDTAALALTLATLGYIPQNAEVLFKEHLLQLKKHDMVVVEDWLDIVWSLVVLNKATHEHISSVLDPSFISLLMEPEIPIPKALKLMNINSIAMLELKDDYKGPLLEENSEIFSKTLASTKEKNKLVKAVLEPLKSLLPSSTVINTNVDTGMGFILDIECIIDENCGRTLINDSKKQLKEPLRLAIVTQGYHEFTRGSHDPLGVLSLQTKLLELANYKLLSVPYTEFNVQTTLITRLKYLSQRITSLVETCSK